MLRALASAPSAPSADSPPLPPFRPAPLRAPTGGIENLLQIPYTSTHPAPAPSLCWPLSALCILVVAAAGLELLRGNDRAAAADEMRRDVVELILPELDSMARVWPVAMRYCMRLRQIVFETVGEGVGARFVVEGAGRVC
ncbi:hypothetical protein BDK51DRAFT_45961 [Blyttiomyces helicus]|uniref:Uncharacterized protein n=1 Tax=Blyttiomyces helicus TaxID=388810 RepID=A0A4P9VX81_9FUNG|nr:hypothetical protein BDK51DRAFT_45961 [Blyttiomyces helicus]|eukprot:RKO82888.1 hypothetical protein BDK51DRAFT_45961 [Blyttiomyces helicus]